MNMAQRVDQENPKVDRIYNKYLFLGIIQWEYGNNREL
jgi:hypothetical protein